MSLESFHTSLPQQTSLTKPAESSSPPPPPPPYSNENNRACSLQVFSLDMLPPHEKKGPGKNNKKICYLHQNLSKYISMMDAKGLWDTDPHMDHQEI